MTNIESSSLDRVPLPELADELRCRKQTLFKIAKRLGILPVKQRDAERRNQLVATVTTAEALALQLEVSKTRKTADSAESSIDPGLFYIVQLEPELDPNRIKLGFTTDLEGRLRKHRCSAPFASSLKTWPCRSTWERAAIDCIAAGLEQLHTEIFRANSLEDLIKRANAFFSLMPTVAIATDLPDEPTEEDI